LLRQLKCSLLVTTFQQRKLIVVRSDSTTLYTDFVELDAPMGLAVAPGRIVVAGRHCLYEFSSMPTLAMDSEAPGDRDALYLLRKLHVTGRIATHEIAFAGDECWFVNTRFSCLCTLDPQHSFVPRWRPRFITGYGPQDRCHLNGLAVHAGRPSFVTALGESNAVSGWRAAKRDGGVLIDVQSNEIVARGLSMPHSPRFYRDRLWLLESGKGSLATADLATGKLEIVRKLPGFTRGLDFFGPFAFVGLSQLRASNPFADIPLTDENPERASGIWVVNIETGKTVAFLRFSGSVEEIFGVQLLRGAAHPHIFTQDSPELERMWALPDAAIAEIEFTAPGQPASAEGVSPPLP
jgi:uncharacterized protein (TIGR03032 family)